RRLNGIGPDDVAVTAAEVVADGFNARHDAKARSYRYRLLARSAPSPFELGKALWWPHRVDREALDACAAALPGTHDFTAFTPTETDHVRFQRNIFSAAWLAEEVANVDPHIEGETFATPGAGHDASGSVLAFWIEADAFMRDM